MLIAASGGVSSAFERQSDGGNSTVTMDASRMTTQNASASAATSEALCSIRCTVGAPLVQYVVHSTDNSLPANSLTGLILCARRMLPLCPQSLFSVHSSSVMHALRRSRVLCTYLASTPVGRRPAYLTTRYLSATATSPTTSTAATPTFTNLLLSHTGALVTITLNRPAVHNCFNEHVIADLTAAFTHPLLSATANAAAADTPRAVVLRSAGVSFSAGGDLNWMGKMKAYSREENVADARRLFDMFYAIHSCPLPVIGRVQGAAYGGGVGLIAACDTSVAVRSATLALTEVKLGLAPAVISPFVLNKTGVSAAVNRALLTADRLTAAEAHSLGLIGTLVDNEEDLDSAVERIVHNLTSAGPEAVRRTKRLMQEVSGSNERLQRVKQYVTELIAELRVSAEGQEGVGAFLDKRKPSWLLPSSDGHAKADSNRATKAST